MGAISALIIALFIEECEDVISCSVDRQMFINVSKIG